MAEIARLDAILSGKVESSFLESMKTGKELIEKFSESGKTAASTITKSFKGIATAAVDVATELFTTLAPLAAVGLAIMAISEVVQEYEQAEKEAAERTAEFNKEIGNSTAKVNTELTKLSALVQVARDHSESLKVRKNAIQELQKEYPGYLSNINLENINSQEATNAINGLADALERKAKVQAYSNLLTKANEDLIAAQNAPLGENITLLDQGLSILANGGNVAGEVGDLVTKSLGKQAEKVKTLQGVVDSYSHTLSQLTQAQAKAGDFIIKPTKDTNKSPIAINTPENKAKIRDDSLALIDHTELTLTRDASNIKPGIITKPFEVSKEAVTALGKELTYVLQDTIEQGLEATGEVIGNIISGKKSPFAALFEIIGMGIKEFGKQLIIFSGIAQLAQIAIKQAILNPYLALAAGIALEALGTVIANKGVQLHADGGIFTQPTQWGNHIIGEKGPEALVPLNRMNELGLAGGGRHIVVMDTRISGNDLILIQNRAQTAANRAYGSNFNRRN